MSGRFQPPPCPIPARTILCAQFVVAALCLAVVRPPFVCHANGALDARLVVAIALASTAACVAAAASGATPGDIFRGALEAARR